MILGYWTEATFYSLSHSERSSGRVSLVIIALCGGLSAVLIFPLPSFHDMHESNIGPAGRDTFLLGWNGSRFGVKDTQSL